MQKSEVEECLKRAGFIGPEVLAREIASELEPLFAELEQQAKERQREAGGDRKSKVYQADLRQKILDNPESFTWDMLPRGNEVKSVVELIPQPISGERKTRHKIAQAVGTNGRYITDARSRI